ncbi:hypothetical protein COLSTE_02563, partial [Collinsella stercoris DSM 13279]
MKPPTATSAMATAAMSGLFERFFFMGTGARLGSDESSGVDSTLTVDSFSVRGEPQDGQNEEPSGAFFPHLGQNILPPFKLVRGPAHGRAPRNRMSLQLVPATEVRACADSGHAGEREAGDHGARRV